MQMRASNFFCQFTLPALKDFNAVKSPASYPAGALLFLEKQDSRGVFILCAGEVKLSISSSAGKTLILRIAKAGEILGLMAALSNSPYEVRPRLCVRVRWLSFAAMTLCVSWPSILKHI